MASKNVEILMKQLNETGEYDSLYPKLPWNGNRIASYHWTGNGAFGQDNPTVIQVDRGVIPSYIAIAQPKTNNNNDTVLAIPAFLRLPPLPSAEIGGIDTEISNKIQIRFGTLGSVFRIQCKLNQPYEPGYGNYTGVKILIWSDESAREQFNENNKSYSLLAFGPIFGQKSFDHTIL